MKTSYNKPYRFINRSNRNIEVVFAHMPNKHISTGTRDMSEAVLFAEKYLQHDGITSIHSGETLLKEFAKDFFTRRDSLSFYARMENLNRQKQDKFYVNHQAYLDNYIIPGLGNFKLSALNSMAIENWLLNVKGVMKDDIAADTRIKILDCLKTVLNEAVREGAIKYNPADKVLRPRGSEIEMKGKRIFSTYEQNLLMPQDKKKRIEIWGGLMWASYFSLLSDTGFRSGEAAGVRVCDVYRTPQGFGVIAEQQVDPEGKKILKRVKTSGRGMEKRVALLSDTTAELIQDLVKYIKDDNECLFLLNRIEKDSYIGCNTANKHLRGVLKKLGLQDATQYSFRHTFATFRRGNMEEKALAFAMGHAGGTVRDNYDHRTASILLNQLEEHRDEIFSNNNEKELSAVPINFKKKA